MQEILAAAKVNPGSFHFLFRSKENLLIAILDHLANQTEEHVFTPPFSSRTTPLDRVWGRFRRAAKLLASFDPHGFPGCTVAMIAANVGSRARNPRVYRHAKSILARWEEIIVGELVEAVAAGQLPKGTSVHKMARRLLAFYLGASMLGRIESDPVVLRELFAPLPPLSPRA